MTRGRPLPHSLFFSKKTRAAGILPHSSGSLSFCFSGTMCLGFTSQCEFTCVSFRFVSFPKGKRASEESPGSFKAGRKIYVDQGIFSCVNIKWRCGKRLSKGSPSSKTKTSKRRYVETAGSEQTSSVFMLWVKTRVYILCSGRAGGNERDLLFYVRYEETWLPLPLPLPSLFLIDVYPLLLLPLLVLLLLLLLLQLLLILLLLLLLLPTTPTTPITPTTPTTHTIPTTPTTPIIILLLLLLIPLLLLVLLLLLLLLVLLQLHLACSFSFSYCYFSFSYCYCFCYFSVHYLLVLVRV